MLRVFFINSVFGRGSTGKIISDLGSAVREIGGEFSVAYGRGVSFDQEHGYRISTKADVLIHALLARFTDSVGLHSQSATRKLVKRIKEFNPDVIHLHNIHGYYVNIKILFDYLKKEYRGKVIWTLHDCWAFTGHCVHYTYRNCNNWLSGCGKCPEKKRYPKSCVLDKSKRNYKVKENLFTNIPNLTIVTPSGWLCEQVKRSFLKNYKVEVINNGIDLQIFRPDLEQSKMLSKQKIVLNVSDGFDARKGHLDLLKLRELLPLDYRIVVVGVDGVKEKYKKSGIEWIGRTDSQKALAKLYSQSLCLVNPTYEDTYPTINIEALACGTSVVAYNTCGAAEIISDGCGIKVKPGDIEGLANAILSIDKLTNREICINIASRYDKKRMCSQYLDVYCAQ